MNFFSGVRRTALQSQSCPKNNMGASLGFFGRVRPTFPWARGWSAGVRRRRRPTRRVSPSLCGPVGAGRAALGLPGSRARPTRSGALKPGRLGIPVAPGPDGQTRRLISQRPGKGPGSRARPTRSASGVAFTESPSQGLPTRSEAVESCRLGVESRSSRARPGPTRSGVVDSQ